MGRRLVVTLLTLLGLWLAAPAGAEVVAGTPDESIPEAYGPMAPGTAYSGAFDNTSYDDVDYLAFRVTQAGQTLEFTVANTTSPCNDPDEAGCPVYATLMDDTDQQVGGDSSSAGTVATAGDLEQIDWTFAQPGTYYLLMESNGDEAPGSPSYTVGYTVLGGSVPAGNPAPVLKSLTVARRQHGSAVLGRLVLGQPVAVLQARLVAGHRLVRMLTQRAVSSGAHRLRLPLPGYWRARLKRAHSLALVLRLTLVTASGRRLSYRRPVTVSP